MNDRNAEFQGEIHEGSSHTPCDEFGVRCFALQNNAKRENDIELALHGDQLHRQGNFERARNPDDGNARPWLEFVDFPRGGIHQGLNVGIVVLAGYDGKGKARTCWLFADG